MQISAAVVVPRADAHKHGDFAPLAVKSMDKAAKAAGRMVVGPPVVVQESPFGESCVALTYVADTTTL